MLIPAIAFSCFPFLKFERKLSIPLLLNPNLFIKALSSSSLKIRGLGFPYWGLIVVVPHSIKPNPIRLIALITSAFLSKPAANPIGLLILRPAIEVLSIGSSFF